MTTKKVSPENKCDVCKEADAIYYDTTWYIHYCSTECFDKFVKGYNREIDEVAIEVKTATELFEDINIEGDPIDYNAIKNKFHGGKG